VRGNKKRNESGSYKAAIRILLVQNLFFSMLSDQFCPIVTIFLKRMSVIAVQQYS